ncbi:hypothetical protein ACHAXT_008760 [Thalassiosira profunda]
MDADALRAAAAARKSGTWCQRHQCIECEICSQAFRATLQRIDGNDPALTSISCGRDIYPPTGDDWRELGAAIGRNANLTSFSMHPYGEEGSEQFGDHWKHWLDFLRGVALNQSIKEVVIDEFHFFVGQEGFDILASLYGRSRVERLRINNYEGSTHALALNIAHFHSLESFALKSYDSPHEIIRALAGHPELRELELDEMQLYGDEPEDAMIAVQRHGQCNELSTLLRIPESNLVRLKLHIPINDGKALALAQGLKRNRALRDLYISNTFLTATGWCAFFQLLCNKEGLLRDASSNHTLREVHCNGVPQNILDLLQINRENSPRVAARLKIVKHCFSDVFAVPFEGMDLAAMPQALAFVAVNNGEREEQVSWRLFDFLRSMAAMFGTIKQSA